MQAMSNIFNPLRSTVRYGMGAVARLLNTITGGRLHPDAVTLIGVVMHVPIAVLIALRHYNMLAAVLLLVFGLFDTLDGELARLQGRASPRGMLLDAATDRMKETLLYAGIGYALALSSHPATASLAAAACGASLCVSYVKAKGEAAVAASERAIPHHTLNRLFADGFLTFEIRMSLLVAALLLGWLAPITAFIAVFAGVTAVQRLVRISKALERVQS